MVKIINYFKITDNFEIFVSDGGSNMLSAFDNHFFNRGFCICHIINLILQDLHVLFKDKLKKLGYIQSIIKNSTIFPLICTDYGHSITKISSFSTSR